MPPKTPRSLVAAAALTLVALVAPLAAEKAAADPVATGFEHCVVNVRTDDTLNMRERPTASARVVSRKRYGDCGILVNATCSPSWCPVEDGHSLGWVNRRYIAAVSAPAWCVTGVPSGDVLYLRAYPSPQSRVVTQLDRRTCGLALLPYRAGSWQKVRIRGWQGWVSSRYLARA